MPLRIDQLKEISILNKLAEGLSPKKIAHDVGVSLTTVYRQRRELPLFKRPNRAYSSLKEEIKYLADNFNFSQK